VSTAEDDEVVGIRDDVRVKRLAAFRQTPMLQETVQAGVPSCSASSGQALLDARSRPRMAPRITVTLNGNFVNDYQSSRQQTGYIALQAHDFLSRTQFRNISVKKLAVAGARDHRLCA
jgi:hypothetical protein